MRRLGAYALLGGGDPLRGETRKTEEHLLHLSGGKALFVVPQALQAEADAWCEIYKSLGARDVRVLVLKRREQAQDVAVAETIAGSPLILLAAEDAARFLNLVAGTRLVEALATVYLRGGIVAALGGVAGVLGAAAPLVQQGRLTARYGLGLLPGLAILPEFEQAGRFSLLTQLVVGNPDLLGLGVEAQSAVLVDFEGNARVIAGQVTVLDAAESRIYRRSVRGLKVDVLGEGETFKVPVYHA